jgi:hypothetical protein
LEKFAAFLCDTGTFSPERSKQKVVFGLLNETTSFRFMIKE